MRAGRNRKHQPILADRPAVRLARIPIRRDVVTVVDPPLPEDVHAPLARAPGAEGDRQESHRLPEVIRGQVLRAPATIQLAPVRAALEDGAQQARADELPLLALGHAELVDHAELVALEVTIFGDDVTDRR